MIEVRQAENDLLDDVLFGPLGISAASFAADMPNIYALASRA